MVLDIYRVISFDCSIFHSNFLFGNLVIFDKYFNFLEKDTKENDFLKKAAAFFAKEID